MLSRLRAGRPWTIVALLVATSLMAGLAVVFAKSRARPVEAPSEPPNAIALVVVASGLESPTDVQFVPGFPHTAVALQKGGKAALLSLPEPGQPPTSVAAAPLFLDEAVRTDWELGLLGLAFHPRWAENGLLYVNLTPADGEMRTMIAEYELSKAELGRRPATRKRVILEVLQPYANHNAGQLAFGPDGMLYVGLGDGGLAADPMKVGQDLTKLLGKMLRLDVDHPKDGLAYSIPPDNPFLGRADARPEIWAYGLRNPWRYSFTPDGHLVVADVGQEHWEEIDIVTAGANLGWSRREGRHCFPADAGSCPDEGFTDPLFEYGHHLGVCVTGGYVALGGRVPRVRGAYVFGDFGSGNVWALWRSWSSGREISGVHVELLGHFPRQLVTFGRDLQGDLYVADYGTGDLMAVTAAP